MSFSHPQYKSMRPCHCITAGGGQCDQWTLLAVGGRSSRASADPNISVIFNFHAIFCWFVPGPPPALLSWPRELSIRVSLSRGCDTHQLQTAGRFATVFLWPHQFVTRSIIFAVDLNPTKRVIRVSAMRSKKVTGTLQTHHSSTQLRMFGSCSMLVQIAECFYTGGVVGDLLTILRFHCKHYDSKEATVGLHFLIKFISLKRTWNAKSWHLKWKFAKLPPIPPQRHTFITSLSLLCYNNIFISYEWFLKQIFFTTQSQVVKCCQ